MTPLDINPPFVPQDTIVSAIQVSRKAKPRQFTMPLTIYLTTDQIEMLKQRAKNYGGRVGRCAREALVRGCQRRLPADVEGKVLSEVEDAIDGLRALRMVLPFRSKNGQAIDAALEHLTVAQATLRQVKAAKATHEP